MNTIVLKDRLSDLTATIYPDHGGLVGKLAIGEVNVLKLDESKLGVANVLAGGIPILFPFASKTTNDRYTLNGKEYHMPVHGFVKDTPFAVEEVTENSAVLWMESSNSLMASCYPFSFVFKVKYTVKNSTLNIEATLINNSGEDMPHSLGWHPYYATSNKEALEFYQSYQRYYDYINCCYGEHNKPINLTEELNNVYCDPVEQSFSLKNKADGYSITQRFDPEYKTLVVFTLLPDAVCLEPWIGIPDSINRGEYLSIVRANSARTYSLMLEVNKL
ncbi:MAG TPA: hypothetical protein GXX14_02990 [Clostridiaceae bacterium]|nr:hypothetical protein [Clostridiaceae bacterium]